MRKCAIAAVAVLLAVAFSAPAFAHRLNVYAWLENDDVLVECNFGNDRPARQAAVSILDGVTKKELIKGQTDASGRYVFRVPDVIREGHGLIIDVNAGEGHRGEWTMDASELYAAASLTAGFEEAAIDSGEQPASSGTEARGPSADGSHRHLNISSPGDNMALPSALTQEQIKSAVNDALESRLAPIRQHLAAQAAKGPGITEIVGGIGWIIGLVGIFLYFKSRRRND